MYYLVRQQINKKIHTSFKIYEPINMTHFQTFLDHLSGRIYVYRVNEEDNSTENLTNQLGKTEFDYSLFKQSVDALNKSLLRFRANKGGWSTNMIVFYSVDYPTDFFPKEFFCWGRVTFPYFQMIESIVLEERDHDAHSKIKGVAYERFVGKAYEEHGYQVEYRGEALGKQDAGIDLIAVDDEKIALVQCKNWIEIENYQIDDRDLRAFIGDCYLFLLQNTFQKAVAFHFIVSDMQMLSDSAKHFLQNNQVLKLKELRFEK